MTEHAFRAMDSEWWLRAAAPLAVLVEAEQRVHAAEQRLSRFRNDSLLSQLNRCRTLRDGDLAAIAGAALRLREATGGAFDPTIGAALLAAGYDRSFEAVAARSEAPAAAADQRHPALTVDGDRVTLAGEGLLDLGGIAKGWTVDRVAECFVAHGFHDYVVDGGGDIRVGGHNDGEPWTIAVGDGLTASLRTRLHDRAVATSSTLRRRWRTAAGEAHHIIAPATGRPAAGTVVTATVIAPDATTADVLATALIADRDRALAALESLEAEALLLERDGAWTMTAGMARYLR